MDKLERYLVKRANRLEDDPSRLLREVAYELLKDAITYADLQPGEPLSETRLSKALGISRTPVREALQQLAREGLVQVIPGRAVTVAAPSIMQEVMNVVHVRLLLPGSQPVRRNTGLSLKPLLPGILKRLNKLHMSTLANSFDYIQAAEIIRNHGLGVGVCAAKEQKVERRIQGDHFLISNQTKEVYPCHDQSHCSPGNGPICPWKNWPRRSVNGGLTAWSLPAGATTLRWTRPWKTIAMFSVAGTFSTSIT